MKLSIIIPIYNEKNTLEEIVSRIEKVDLASINFEKQLIFVDDFSTDGTRDILKNIEQKNKGLDYKFIYHDKNYGKGRAVRDGFKAADGDWVIIQDADLEYNPQEIPMLLDLATKNNFPAVFGSRFMKKKIQNLHGLINGSFTLYSNIMSGQKLTDMWTCYKLIRADIAKDMAYKLISDRFGIEPEISAYLGQNNYKVVEASISYNPRSKDQGKKIGLKDGIRATASIFYFNKIKSYKK